MRHPLESLVFMATVQQKVDCVLWLTELKSPTRVQLKFRIAYWALAPSYNSINKWDRSSNETGIIVNHKSPGRPRTYNEALVRSPFNLIRIARRQVHLPTSHFMTFYTNFYVPVNCSCGNTSIQPTVTVERDSVRKCCRKLIYWYIIYYLFKLQMGFYPVAVVLQ
jgi:hypothetical protein